MDANGPVESQEYSKKGTVLHTAPDQTQFLDHRKLDWNNICAARYNLEQSFEYTYPGPIYDLRQRLITIPPDIIGDQRLLSYQLNVSSPLAYTTTTSDSFGNRVNRITVPYVEERIAFAMKMVIER